MVTNNSVRVWAGVPESYREFDIYQVDMLRANDNTLMFINKPDIDLVSIDNSCNDCIILIDKSLYSEYQSTRNDLVFLENPKYEFSLVVEKLGLKSRFQREETEQVIGYDCHFDEGTIIGGTDFSPVISTNSKYLIQFPQMGGVHIGNHVLVKYNSMIGKGTFDYTRIGDYTMIDYGCQIGHNCQIGERCIIAAGTIIGGSTTIGNDTVIGIGAKIRNGIKIGNNVSIGMGSVVIRDIPDNTVVVGNPAHPIEHKKIFDEGGLI